MSIIRAPRPEANFYVLSKSISEDARLTWAARGLLVYLLGKPDHWQISVESLRRQTEGARVRTGRDGVYALLGELESTGYLQRVQGRSVGGRLAEVDYSVSEVPSNSPLPDQPDTAPPLPAQPYPANPTLVSTDTKQELSKAITPLPPKGARAVGDGPSHRAKGSKGGVESEHFVEFYAAYPRKVNRPAAAKAWAQKGCDALAANILADVRARVAEDPQWAKDRQQFIPHPATYLNGRRWEDQWRMGGDDAGDIPSWLTGAI